MGDQSCQFEHCICNFILWKISSIKLVFDSIKLRYLKPGLENVPTTRLRGFIFCSHPYGCNFYLTLYAYGFAAAIGTWVFVYLSISAGDYDDIVPWPVSKTIQLEVREQLHPLNSWSQTLESKELTRPTSVDFSTVPAVRWPYFFPHTKLFNETEGYLYNDTMCLKFLDPSLSTPTQSSFLFPSA